ncbi:MAG TPA: extracellular solute-binding protein [Thermomicrobiales bacterium]|nr:extracellular solute-binding protein [Thermomicrobiales bacterium]
MTSTRLTRRRIVQLGAATAGVAATGIAPLPSARRAAAQGAAVRFWNVFYPTEDPNDRTKRLEDFYIYQAVARFQEQNPGVAVEIETIPGGSEMFTKYRTASVAANGPDVMGMWSGSYMLGVRDFLEPMAPYFSAEERARITGWEAVAADFRADSDEIYGVPAGSDGTSCIYCNLEMLAAAGVEPDGAWRNSFDGFVGALDAIKATGVTPMALEENAIIWQILSWWQAQELGGAGGIGQLVSGEANFSTPEMIGIVQNWQRLKDYTVPGAETMPGDAAFQLFFGGQVAMTTATFSVISNAREALGDNLGMIKLPNISPEAPLQDGGIGGAGIAFIVSNYSEAKDEAVAFIKFLMSPEEQTLKAESGEGSLLNVTDVDAAGLYEDPLKQTQQEWANEPSTVFWLDNLYPVDLTNEIKAQSQLAWTGQITAEEFLARADAKRDELLDS